LRTEKTKRVLNMALEMMKYVEKVTYGVENHPIKIKIGIHNGKAIAGIIGNHKP
jgi:class 3 adenylate cyclase